VLCEAASLLMPSLCDEAFRDDASAPLCGAASPHVTEDACRSLPPVVTLCAVRVPLWSVFPPPETCASACELAAGAVPEMGTVSRSHFSSSSPGVPFAEYCLRKTLSGDWRYGEFCSVGGMGMWSCPSDWSNGLLFIRCAREVLALALVLVEAEEGFADFAP